MYAWESIQKVLDYIEENLTQSHTPEALSKVAALSPFYFQRLFTRLVNRPVNEYIKLRRLAWACQRLDDRSQRILDIALDCGFQSHEHFTKTFKSAFRITPEQYRANPVRLNQVMKPELSLGYTMIDENVPLISGKMVLEISRRTIDTPENYIGFSGLVQSAQQMPLGGTTGIDAPGQLWEIFHSKKHAITGRDPEGIEFAASTMQGCEPGTFSYFVGASALPGATAYEEYELWQLPAAEYIVCTFEAEHFEELVNEALDQSMNYLFGTWLPSHNLATRPFSAEKYTSVGPEGCKMELWVIPVPKKQ